MDFWWSFWTNFWWILRVLLMLYWCCLICFLMYFDGFRGGNVSRVYRVCIWTCQSCYRVHSNMMLDCLKLVEFVFDSFLKHSETNFKIKGTLTRFGVIHWPQTLFLGPHFARNVTFSSQPIRSQVFFVPLGPTFFCFQVRTTRAMSRSFPATPMRASS